MLAGNFREDLYYRLQVVAINIPALERSRRVTSSFCPAFHRQVQPALRPEHHRTVRRDRDIFLKYPWPGNVRELENLLERIFILEDDDAGAAAATCPTASCAPCAPAVPPSRRPPRTAIRTRRWTSDFHAATEKYQKALIEQALAASRNNLKDAAALLKISRHALRHQMIKLGMLDA